MRYHNVPFSLGGDLLFAHTVRIWSDGVVTVQPFPRCLPWRTYRLTVENASGEMLYSVKVRRPNFEKRFEVVR